MYSMFIHVCKTMKTYWFNPFSAVADCGEYAHIHNEQLLTIIKILWLCSDRIFNTIDEYLFMNANHFEEFRILFLPLLFTHLGIIPPLPARWAALSTSPEGLVSCARALQSWPINSWNWTHRSRAQFTNHKAAATPLLQPLNSMWFVYSWWFIKLNNCINCMKTFNYSMKLVRPA